MNLLESLNEGFNKAYGDAEKVPSDRLVESLTRILEKMSPEDEKDTALIRSILSKRSRRQNAALTPEEKAVIAKYNLALYDSNENPLVAQHPDDPRSKYYQDNSIRPPRYLPRDRRDKVNLADMARKRATRTASHIIPSKVDSYGGFDTQATSTHHHSSWNKKGNDSALDLEREALGRASRERLQAAQSAVGSKNTAQTKLDSSDERYQKAITAAREEYNKKLAQLAKDKSWDDDYYQRELKQANDTLDRLYPKRTKK